VIPYLRAYQKQGLSFFPLPYKSKAANIKWDTFQRRKPTEAEIEAWFNGRETNVAVVCGKISDNLVVLDCDSKERYAELGNIIKEKLGIEDINDSTWITETGRGFQIWFKVTEDTKSAKFPMLDIKAEGGYVVAPPSIHPTGKRYKFVNPETPLRTIPSLVSIGIDAQPEAKPNDQQPNWLTKALEGVGEGERNDMCAKLAGYFVNKHQEDITISLLLDWNKKNTPPLPEKEIYLTTSHAYRKYDRGQRGQWGIQGTGVYGTQGTQGTEGTLADRVRQWVFDSSGWFDTREIDDELKIYELNDKENRKKVLQRMKVADEITQNPATNRLWRRVDKDADVIDIKGTTRISPKDIRWPFSIEDLYDCRQKNIIVLPGLPDAGKTAFLLNVVAYNQDKHDIWYFSSEMTADELLNRLDKFDDVEEWNFQARERSHNFADVIRPDAINIIDYMEIADYSQAENMIREIHDKLKTGVAIIALQKNRGTDIARGGMGTMAKARLYMAMDNGRLKIVKCKNWHDKMSNPNGKVATFQLVNGCQFRIIRPWHYEEDDD